MKSRNLLTLMLKMLASLTINSYTNDLVLKKYYNKSLVSKLIGYNCLAQCLNIEFFFTLGFKHNKYQKSSLVNKTICLLATTVGQIIY